jgi:hypothetical protein
VSAWGRERRAKSMGHGAWGMVEDTRCMVDGTRCIVDGFNDQVTGYNKQSIWCKGTSSDE